MNDRVPSSKVTPYFKADRITDSNRLGALPGDSHVSATATPHTKWIKNVRRVVRTSHRIALAQNCDRDAFPPVVFLSVRTFFSDPFCAEFLRSALRSMHGVESHFRQAVKSRISISQFAVFIRDNEAPHP